MQHFENDNETQIFQKYYRTMNIGKYFYENNFKMFQTFKKMLIF